MIDLVRPDSMPAAARRLCRKAQERTAKSDDPKTFCTKAEYLDAMKKQRAGTLAVLDEHDDADFDNPAPEPLTRFLKNVRRRVHDASIALADARRPMGHAAPRARLARRYSNPVALAGTGRCLSCS